MAIKKSYWGKLDKKLSRFWGLPTGKGTRYPYNEEYKDKEVEFEFGDKGELKNIKGRTTKKDLKEHFRKLKELSEDGR